MSASKLLRVFSWRLAGLIRGKRGSQRLACLKETWATRQVEGQ